MMIVKAKVLFVSRSCSHLVGKIKIKENIKKKIKINVKIKIKLDLSQGLAHTRWATHGEPSEVNCHPQVIIF